MAFKEFHKFSTKSMFYKWAIVWYCAKIEISLAVSWCFLPSCQQWVNSRGLGDHYYCLPDTCLGQGGLSSEVEREKKQHLTGFSLNQPWGRFSLAVGMSVWRSLCPIARNHWFRLNHESFSLLLKKRFSNIISRPGQSQGLLYKHIRNSFIH